MNKNGLSKVCGSNPAVILASASPRRKELLTQIGVGCICMPVDIDEAAFQDEPVVEYVSRLAKEKAQAGWELRSEKVNEGNLPVLGADTIVVYQGKLLGKPNCEAEAFETLKLLSGQKHQVFSAVALCSANGCECLVSENWVEFSEINEASILCYIATGEPMDKAGSYGIQGLAAVWIKRIEGSYSSVMGLPLYETAQLLKNSI